MIGIDKSLGLSVTRQATPLLLSQVQSNHRFPPRVLCGRRAKLVALLKKVVKAPGVDPHVGCYEYGWHGSYTRTSNLFKCVELHQDDGQTR
jgi:hypothetical protein